MNTLRSYRRRVANRLVRVPTVVYVWLALAVLGVSTLAWSLAAARLQQSNADQLADGFLFEHAATFSRAVFPASHTQLLKWPLFWMLGVLHSTPTAYLFSTVVLCLATVGGLAFVLAKIVHRRSLLALLYLCLACVLVLVPAQVLGGVSAPLGMAMVTGRNVEYVLYIAVLLLLLPRRAVFDWWRWGGAVVLLTLLLASDQLFLVYSLGGAAVLLVAAYMLRHHVLTGIAGRWLTVSAGAWLLSELVLRALGPHVVGALLNPNGGTPAAGLQAATVYALKAVLVNFGVTTYAGWLSVIAALCNVGILAGVLYTTYVICRRALPQQVALNRPVLLSLLLITSTIAALGSYVFAGHPVVADARYLGLVLFTGFITLAACSNSLRLKATILYSFGVGLALAVMLGTVGVVLHTNHTIAHDQLRVRNQRVVAALADHPEQILVGNYWRVVPVKAMTERAGQQILPLGSCLQPRQSLTSAAWAQDLYTHSFAYLLSVLPDGTPFGRCSLRTIESIYGTPSSIVRIAGSGHNPTELLLFYNDGGAKRRENKRAVPNPVFGVPTTGTANPTGSTIVPLANPS